jgi:anti-sigma factor RsiW
MSCRKTHGLDLAAYLVEPDAAEWSEFRRHYATCPDCAAEVELWTRIESGLREGGASAAAAHPAAEELLRFEETPQSLPAVRWQQVDRHLRECRPCADQLAALRAFDFPALEAAAPPSPSRALGALVEAGRGWLTDLAARLAGGAATGDLLPGPWVEPEVVFQEAPAAAERPQPVAVLVGVEGESSGSVHPILAGESRVGRDRSCEVRVASDALSRVEALIRADAAGVRVVAAGPRSRVAVNGAPVSDSALEDGDRLDVAGQGFEFRRVGRAGATATRAPRP